MARPYRSPTRDAAREATRAKVLDAALGRFVADGYRATTIALVAADAQVSVQTVFDGFGTKGNLLQAAARAAASGSAEESVVDEAWLGAIASVHGHERRWALLRARTATTLERSLPLQRSIREAAASDPVVADLWEEMEAERRRDVERVVDHLLEEGPLRVPATEAADILFALGRATDLYASLVDAGWSSERASACVSDVAARAIFPL